MMYRTSLKRRTGEATCGLTGKVALITGAGRAVRGREAQLFAALGAQVAVTDIDLEAARAVAAGLDQQGLAIGLDVSSAESWQSAVTTVVQRFGRVDIPVNNAGFQRRDKLLDCAVGDLRDHNEITVNLVGATLGLRCVAPHMPTGGSMVNIGSAAAFKGLPGALLYLSSKWRPERRHQVGGEGVRGLGIRVNAVCPGAVDTPMNDGLSIDLSTQPILRMGTPDEIAAVVAFVASDAASYVNGTEFVVDGGLLAWAVR